MKNIFCKCLSAYLMVHLAFGAAFIFADDDQWGDFDSAVPYTVDEPEPETSPEEAVEPPQYETYDSQPQYEYEAPAYEAYQPQESYEPLESFDSYLSPDSEDKSSASKFVTVIRSDRLYESTFQDAIIEGLQFVAEPSADVENEIAVSCYFIFRDRPTSYFYDVNRKDKKLVFEFADARTGSSPISVDEYSPIKGITIEELQVDANKEIKGLNPEWHNYIRITMNLSHIPVISVSDESSIISFRYKWSTNAEKYPLYVEPNKFPLVFWLSAGGLGAIGIGLLTYFLIPKKEKPVDNTLGIDDLPCRPAQGSGGC